MMQSKFKKVIIITGGIGTGKSTAVSILQELGYTVLDSDKIVHENYQIGRDLYNNVIKLFGKDILDYEGNINRDKLGKIVFENKGMLEKLNNIVHKTVIETLKSKIEEYNSKNIIFLDIPLAFEIKDKLDSYKLIYDEIWLVYVNKELQIERLKKRAIKEKKNIEYVLSIINEQISISEKMYLADEIINNEEDIENLRENILKLMKKKVMEWQ